MSFSAIFQIDEATTDSYLWDAKQAQFTRNGLVCITSAPVFLSIVIVVLLGFRRFFPRPSWVRNLISEDEDEDASTAGPQSRMCAGPFVVHEVISLSGLICSGVAFTQKEDKVMLLDMLAWMSVFALVLVLRPRMFSVPLLMMYICIAVSHFALLFLGHGSFALNLVNILQMCALLLSVAGTLAALSMPLRPHNISKHNISTTRDKPNPDLRSPEDGLTAWQFMTVSWLKPLLSLGSKRQLNEEDVWFLGYEFQHRRLHDAFRALQGTVLRRLIVANGLDLVITTALGIFETLCQVFAPVLLQRLLWSIQSPEAPLRAAISYAAMALALRLIQSQSRVFSMWYGRRGYERSRGEMITMLYEKTLSRKISSENPQPEAVLDALQEPEPEPEATSLQLRVLSWVSAIFRMKSKDSANTSTKKAATMGKILNLMRNDAYEVAQRFWDWKLAITTPVEVIVYTAAIWILLGWPCLIGVVTILAAQIFSAILARYLVAWETKRRLATDNRVQSISQFIEGIRHLRWYGWQDAWLQRIIDHRQEELRLMIVTRIWQLAIATINLFASLMFPVVAFWAYCYLVHLPLTLDIAFPAMTLFLMLEQSIRKIPDLITTFLNAAVAMSRIEDFMNEEDKQEYVGEIDEGLGLEEATFAWPRSGKVVLTEVSLRFPVGLTVIGGQVGSGKTALLLALLGELDEISGRCTQSMAAVAYCEQRPWLQSMTIRDNILFYSRYDEARYQRVLEACALTVDLASFQHGELSYIGENGIGLSGGQKSRIALARAIYSRSPVLLLDDPFSSLDQQTAEFITENCLKGSLVEGRTLILVTHRLDLVRHVAMQYVEVSHGRVSQKSLSDLPLSMDRTITSENSTNKSAPDGKRQEEGVPATFMEEEYRAHGSVQMHVYWEYIKAGQIRWWIALIVLFTIMRTFSAIRMWFIKAWAEAYGAPTSLDLNDAIFGRFPDPGRDVAPWVLAFFLFTIAYWLLVTLARGVMAAIVYFAGRQLFKDVVKRVAYAPFRFYDVTPVGRLMNRMTSDIGTIDGDISRVFQEMGLFAVIWVYSFIIVAAITPPFFFFAIATTFSFVYTFWKFLPASQSLRRLEMASLSPLLSDFGALVDGLRTVRAFHMQSRFQDRVIAETDNFQRMDHFFWSAQTWLAYRLDNIAAVSTFLLTLLGLFTGVSAGLIAFALNAAEQFVQATPQICQLYGKLQMDFVSVERVVELIRLDQEPPGDQLPPAVWPTAQGSIVFENVTIRYAPHMDPALSNMSFNLQGGSTTAIIGRTGSGKSTLAAALLATVVPESGTIWIDGVDISRVDKQTLRERITFLAQDPVLFPGTIQQNLDPLEMYSTTDCDRVLQKICAEGHYGWTLDTKVDSGGRNFSQGQRQLIGLARAILRRSAIVILDEATASIDLVTSKTIQDVLREEMQSSTVVTIAHRVEAVQGANSCLELDRGRVLQHRQVDSNAPSVAGSSN